MEYTKSQWKTISVAPGYIFHVQAFLPYSSGACYNAGMANDLVVRRTGLNSFAGFAGVPAANGKEKARLAEIAETADRNIPDDGGATTRVSIWMERAVTGVIVGTVGAWAVGLALPLFTWGMVLGCACLGRRITRDMAKVQTAARWDARLNQSLMRLSSGGSRLPEDLMRLRYFVAQGPTAVEVWRTLPHQDTLTMIRLANQLATASAMTPPPAIELGGDTSETVSRVIEALETSRPLIPPSILRIV